MSSNADSPQIPVVIDLYRPWILPNPAMRLHVLLRRAQKHQQSIDERIAGLTSTGAISQWMEENEGFIQDKKLRMDLCLEQLEDHIRHHPETCIKADVEMLRTQYQFLCNMFGDKATNNVPCTKPTRKAKSKTAKK